MTSTKGNTERLVGITVYARIHENIGRYISLVMDPVDGYLYKGVFAGRVIFENDHEEEHYAMKLARPILRGNNRAQILHLLATPRYKGDEMVMLLEGQELTTSFSHLSDIEIREPISSNVWRFRTSKFETDEFVWVGIGELTVERPRIPYVDAPWDML
jgi:hypothetical protein